MTRKKLTALLGAGLALSMAVCLLAGCSSPAQSTATAAAPAALSQGGVIYLKVNPEIAVRYDEQGMVTSLEGRDPDGKEILTGYTGYEGRECKAVIGELVARINEAGYFVEEVEGDNRQITLEVARVIRVGFLQQNAFHKNDTYVPLTKQMWMMEAILHLYDRAVELVGAGVPVSAMTEAGLFDKLIKVKYEIPNDKPEMFGQYNQELDALCAELLEKQKPLTAAKAEGK